MSKKLRCRLIPNTMTSMIAIRRAKGDGESHRYPSKPEITAMAKRIVLYYPMLQDQGLHTWVTVYTQLNKRLQNVRSPQKRTPDGRHSKSSTKRRCLEQSTDTDEMNSRDSTIILDQSTERSGSSGKERKKRSHSLPEEAPFALPVPVLTGLQMLTIQTPTVQQPWSSTTRPYKFCIKEKIQTTRTSLISRRTDTRRF
ncbi:uncharacterized protein AB9W97_006956 isoform 1-T2 [Spinachia spinachia]